MNNYVKMISVASYLPGNPVPFDEINNYMGELKLSKKLEKWTQRVQPIMKEILGFQYCYYAFDKETHNFTDTNLTMAVKAAKLALEKANMEAKDINLLIYGGAYSKQIPPMSTRIQEELGIDLCAELHIHANCTSIYKAVNLAHLYLKTGEYKNALIVSSNVSSATFLPEYYNQEELTKDDIFLRWYLCDGAGAVILSSEKEKKHGFYMEHSYIESAGGNKISAMGNNFADYWRNPLDEYQTGAHHMRQIYINDMKDYVLDSNGKTIFFNALNRMLENKKINIDELTYCVVNMPSKFICEYIIEECVSIGIPKEKFYSAIEDVGYAGPPAAIISIDNLLKTRTFKDGDLVLSFVMEVSKFMQAGFSLRYKE